MERPFAVGKFESVRCVCFDCDSTLSSIEGIDELAKRAGREAEIAPLTTAAMEGTIAIEDVYARRLEILRPSRSDLDWLGRRYVETEVDGAREAIASLRAAGIAIYVVSGGLKGPVVQLSEALGVAAGSVRAVDVYAGSDGRYEGFESSSPLTRSNGKAEIVRELSASHGKVALVGDGITDVAARAGGAYVIGFGGVVRREAVVKGADIFIDGPSLIDVARLLLA